MSDFHRVVVAMKCKHLQVPESGMTAWQCNAVQTLRCSNAKRCVGNEEAQCVFVLHRRHGA
jgi:hypothetical protein